MPGFEAYVVLCHVLCKNAGNPSLSTGIRGEEKQTILGGPLTIPQMTYDSNLFLGLELMATLLYRKTRAITYILRLIKSRDSLSIEVQVCCTAFDWETKCLDSDPL